MKNLRWMVGGAALVGVLSLAGLAVARPEPVRKPLDVSARSLHTLAVANIIFRKGESSVIGGAEPEMKLRLTEELRKLGFGALGGENLVFGKDKADEARFLLGGTVTDIDCAEQQRWETRQGTPTVVAKVDCAMELAWELLDRESDQVVYKVTTRQAELEHEVVGQHAYKDLAEALLLDSLRSLLERPAFVDALSKDPSATPKAGSATALTTLGFRQCSAAPARLPADSERRLAATALVETDGGSGSGFLISEDGLLLTAAHVVPGAGAKVTLRDGSTRQATVLRRSTKHDVALLSLDGASTPCMPLGLSEPSVGAEVFAMGSPGGKTLAFSVTRGILSGVREVEGRRYLQTDASINPGNSGGPLVDAEGNAVAVVSSKLVGSAVEGIAFGVPVEVALKQLAVQTAAATELQLLRERPLGADQGAAKVVVDTDDRKLVLASTEAAKARAAEEARERAVRDARPGWVTALRYGGYTAAGVGAAMVVGSYLLAPTDDFDEDFDRPTYSGYQRSRTINDVGWVLLGVGVVSAVTSYFVEPAPPATKGSEAPKQATTEIVPEVGLGRVGLRVRY